MKESIRNIELSIREISEKASKQEDVVRWDIGQPSFDTPEHVKEAARNSIEEKQGYTPSKGLMELRKAVAEEESKKKGLSVEPENTMITTGGMEGLHAIFSARLSSEDSVMINDPSWGPYRLISAVNGNGFNQVKYFEDGQLTGEAEKAAESSEMMIVNSPGNPTGKTLTERKARMLAELSERRNCFMVSDEVYWRLTFDREHVSPARFADDAAIIGSTSKNHAMTGWRIGWLTDSESNVDDYNKVSRSMTASPNRVGQRAAIEALQNDSHVEEMREEYRKRRDLVVERMNDLGWRFDKPEGAIYAFPEVGRDSWNLCLDMIEKGVAMVPGEPFGTDSSESVRIAFGSTTVEEIEKGFNILEEEV